MQRRLAELRELWREQGREPLFARIGLNTGLVILGNMGSRSVHDYTVLGDAVNLASRLEGANKIYRTGIMISEATFLQAGDAIHARELDILRVKGKAQAVRVYELLGLREEGPCPLDEGLLAEYAAGLAAYRNRNWRIAMEHFARALQIDPGDGPAQTLLMQARILRNHPPGEGWDGVFTRREE